ncbi:YkvA family protein [Pseudomonas sp. FW507-14TSA]|nr:YkvA family protein [Pseudomonas sp. FW507-14TSA]
MSTGHILEQSFHRCLWRKISRYALHVGRSLITKALWLYYAAQRPETPAWAKSTIYGALGYFVLPLDLIPDVLPGIGYADDLGVLSLSIAAVAAHINQEVKEQAAGRLGEWFGELGD